MKKLCYLLSAVLLLGCCVVTVAQEAGEPSPVNMEEPSEDYEVCVNGTPVFVYKARVSKYPINQEWPGYQRPLDQTEIAAFAYFDYHRGDVITVTPKEKIETCVIRPSSYGIKHTIEDNTVSFKVGKPCQIVVEVNGYHKALHLFVNPKNLARKPDLNDPKVHYFGPGYHDAGVINVKSGETVYVDEGAVVYGCVWGVDVENVTVTGKGILDMSKMSRPFERDDESDILELPEMNAWSKDWGTSSLIRGAVIGFLRSRNVKISGVILRDPSMWTVVTQNCENFVIDNVKLIGLWRYNADGIDLCNSSHIRIRNSFLRTFDDGIVIKGLDFACVDGYKTIRDIRARNCVLWCDWGRALEIGAETYADEVTDIRFKNCEVVRFTHYAVDLQSWHHARVHHLYWKNINAEEPILENPTYRVYPIDPKWFGGFICAEFAGLREWNHRREGLIDHLYYKNIRYTGSAPTYIRFYDWDEEHYVNDVFIRNCTINGRKVTRDDVRLDREMPNLQIK